MQRGNVFETAERIPGRSENFLRDGGQHRLGYCGKGLDVVPPGSFKAKSKNAGPGDRTQDLAARSTLKCTDHFEIYYICLLYTSPSPRDRQNSRMPSSA